MHPIKHDQLTDSTFADAVRGKVAVIEVEDLTAKVPHVGFGGVAKSTYVGGSGRTIYVLERNGAIGPDSYVNDVWQFEEDFSAAAASEFLRAYDAERRG